MVRLSGSQHCYRDESCSGRISNVLVDALVAQRNKLFPEISGFYSENP